MYIDGYTIDGLLDPIYAQLGTTSKLHTVLDSEEGNPQDIANQYYSNVNYYEYILAFNGLGHPSEVLAGMVLEIPVILTTVVKTTTLSI